jgi:hypothetical protein
MIFFNIKNYTSMSLIHSVIHITYGEGDFSMTNRGNFSNIDAALDLFKIAVNSLLKTSNMEGTVDMNLEKFQKNPGEIENDNYWSYFITPDESITHKFERGYYDGNLDERIIISSSIVDEECPNLDLYEDAGADSGADADE